MPKVCETVVIEAPIARVFSVVSDVALYPEFLPEVTDVNILRQGPRWVEAVFSLDLVMKLSCTLRFELSPPNRMSWKLLSGDVIKKNEGSWELDAIEDDVTEATHEMGVEFPFWIPQSLVEPVVKSHLPKMLDAFKRRAEQYPMAHRTIRKRSHRSTSRRRK